MAIEHNGKIFKRTDQSSAQPEPYRASPARPYEIAIRGKFGNLSVMEHTKVALVDSTLKAALYPDRGGAWDKRNQVTIAPRPHYYVTIDGKRRRVDKVQCTNCGFYQKRDQYRANPNKRNGLHSWCRECERAAQLVRDRAS